MSTTLTAISKVKGQDLFLTSYTEGDTKGTVFKPISTNKEERKEGVTWQNHSYYEISGVHLNSARLCQGQLTSACLPVRPTGDMGLLDKGSCSTKTHPAIIFSSNIPFDDPHGG